MGKGLDIVIATNLALTTDEILYYCRDEGIDLSTSLDGPAFIHNANRPRPGGNSHELTVTNIQRARDILGIQHVAALMTTTRLSLDYPTEIIDEYVRLNFRSIFLRSISPYGFALRTQAKTGYDTERFLDFYRKGLAYIVDLNRRGIDFAEVYAKLILTKILTPYPTRFVDLQSPAGAGISVVVYNYDGDVYASDESRMLAEMGEKRFRLGNVHRDDYEAIFGGERGTELIERLLVDARPFLVPGAELCVELDEEEQAAPVAALARTLYAGATVSVCQDHGGYDRVVRVLTGPGARREVQEAKR